MHLLIVYEVVILSFPTVKPLTAQSMNWSSIITIGVLLLSGVWWLLGAHKYYFGPKPNVEAEHEMENYDINAKSLDDKE